MQTIKTHAERCGGVIDVTVRQLRDLVGAGRAGHQVMEDIRDQLRRHGLVYRPHTLTPNQSQVVTLALRGTPAGDLVIAGWCAARTSATSAPREGWAA